MAIFVVAVGTVLAALGCWAMYFGYSIVQVERGWAALIAGAVVFGGGVVTAALGLVLHRLSSIRTALLRQPLAGLQAPGAPAYPDPAPPMLAPQPAPAPQPQLDFSFRAPPSDEEKTVDLPAYHGEPHDPPPPHVTPAHVEAEPVMVAPLLGDVVHEMPHLGPSAVETAPMETAHEPALSGEVPRRDDIDNMWRVLDDELTQTDWTKVLDAEAKAQPAPEHEARIPEPRDAVAAPAGPYRHHESEHPAGAAEPEAAPTSHPAPGGSQSFENFVGDPRLLPAEGVPDHAPAPAAPPPAADESFVPSAYDDDYGDLLGQPSPAAEEAPVEDKAPPAPAGAQAPAGPAAHVMGRYEADGTTYTMYSDGSIEAQSPAGTYRFQSMAELKSFIEQAS